MGTLGAGIKLCRRAVVWLPRALTGCISDERENITRMKTNALSYFSRSIYPFGMQDGKSSAPKPPGALMFAR